MSWWSGLKKIGSGIATSVRFTGRITYRFGRVLNRATLLINKLNKFVPVLGDKVEFLKRTIQIIYGIKKRYKKHAQIHYMQHYKSYTMVLNDIREIQQTARAMLSDWRSGEPAPFTDSLAIAKGFEKMSHEDIKKFNLLMKELTGELFDSAAGEAYRKAA